MLLSYPTALTFVDDIDIRNVILEFGGNFLATLRAPMSIEQGHYSYIGYMIDDVKCRLRSFREVGIYLILVGKEGNKVAHKRNKARMLNTIGSERVWSKILIT